jgi:hypothetical protein
MARFGGIGIGLVDVGKRRGPGREYRGGVNGEGEEEGREGMLLVCLRVVCFDFLSGLVDWLQVRMLLVAYSLSLHSEVV